MYLCNTFSHGAAPRSPHPRRILEMRHSVRLFFQQMESDSILLDPARPRAVPTPPEPAAEAPRGAAEHLHISPDASLVVREFLLDERDASGAALGYSEASAGSRAAWRASLNDGSSSGSSISGTSVVATE